MQRANEILKLRGQSWQVDIRSSAKHERYRYRGG